VSLRPYSPVLPRARRNGAVVEISFVRRSRIDADGWGLLEIPLGETREEYRIEILDGTLVKRSVTVSAPNLIYADETLDFGAAQNSLRLRIAQMSAVAGAGFAQTYDVPIV
jgi:hypothetical protein